MIECQHPKLGTCKNCGKEGYFHEDDEGFDDWSHKEEAMCGGLPYEQSDVDKYHAERLREAQEKRRLGNKWGRMAYELIGTGDYKCEKYTKLAETNYGEEKEIIESVMRCLGE